MKNERKWDWSGFGYALALAVLIALLLGVTACDPCARLARRCPPAASVQDSVYVRDSVWVERWTTDTVVKVKLERETVREVVGISDTAFAETAYACAVSFVMGKSMVLRLWNKDSADMLVRQLNEMKVRLREAYSQRSETKVVTEYRTRGIVKAAAWFGLAALVALLVFIVVKIKKMIMR